MVFLAKEPALLNHLFQGTEPLVFYSKPPRLLNNLFDLEAFTSLIIVVNEACRRKKKDLFCQQGFLVKINIGYSNWL